MASSPAPDVLHDEIQSVRPSTDANLFIQLLVGVLGTALTAVAVIPFKDSPNLERLWGIINDRGPIQYFTLFMFYMVAAMIFLKFRIVRRQLMVIVDDPVPPGVDLSDDQHISELRSDIRKREDFSWSIVLNRIDRLLGLWLSAKQVSRVSTWAAGESGRDTSSSDSSYALGRVLIWAIPILGFIGTVMGLGDAVAGFSAFLAGAAELSAIKDAISDVTIGLGVAFDTTLLALVLSVLVMFPLTSVQRREENFFVEVDNYLEDSLISSLPAEEKQSIVIENLEDSIEAAFRRYIPDPDRYDEVFTRSIERASGVVEERFSALAKSYESTLHDLTARLSGSMATVGDSLEASMRKVAGSIKEQESAFLEARKDISKEEAAQFKSLVEELQVSSEKVLAEYRSGADTLAQSTRESSEKSLGAARELAERIGKVQELAAGIQDLLHIEQAVEQSLKGISASQEFSSTLSELRRHLETTDEFCKHLSKPRVIRLREESA